MKKNVIKRIILGTLLTAALSIEAEATIGDAIYSTGNINIHISPDRDSDLVGVMEYNSQGFIIKESDRYGWIKIKSGDVIGYVANEYFSKNPLSSGYTLAEVNSELLDIKPSKNQNSTAIDLLSNGNMVEVTGEYDGSAWVGVVTKEGLYGYVDADSVILHTYYPTAQKIYSDNVVIEENYSSKESLEVNTAEVIYENYSNYDDEPISETEFPIINEPVFELESEIETEIETEYDNPNTDEPIWEPESEIETEYEEPILEDWPEEPESEFETEYEEPFYEDEPGEEIPIFEDDPNEIEFEVEGEEDYPSELNYSGVAWVANQYLGNPYVWGGSSPGGFDCSGLAQYSYAQMGISIPRVAADQYYSGIQISVEKAVNTPGALIFYHDLGHVGISNGDGTITHASDYDTGVIISDAYYSTPYGAVVY